MKKTTQKQRVCCCYGEHNGTKGPRYSPNSNYTHTNAYYTLALVEEERYGKTD